MRTLPICVTALAITTIISFNNCTKSATAAPPGGGQETSQSPSNSNVPGAYVVTKVESRNGSSRQDITSQWFHSYAGDCAKDDLTTFKPDGSFVVLDGANSCTESTDDTGTWQILNKRQIKIDQDVATIEMLNSTTLRFVSALYSTPQNEIILTYTRQ